ncbi:MAG: ATP-binding protein [Planctomycetaceae bacterium]|nr:ATP-binding protein [Planctomycetaceae bacterium]
MRVRVSLDADSQFAVISVRDNGVGIEPALMARIFQPQPHETSSRNRSGLGSDFRSPDA